MAPSTALVLRGLTGREWSMENGIGDLGSTQQVIGSHNPLSPADDANDLQAEEGACIVSHMHAQRVPRTRHQDVKPSSIENHTRGESKIRNPESKIQNGSRGQRASGGELALK